MKLIPVTAICPFCGERLALVHNYDVYVCQNEHAISGVEMEMIQDGKRATYEREEPKGVTG